jgi:hypothetical protein
MPGLGSFIGVTLGATPGFGIFFATTGAPGSITSSEMSWMHGWGVAIVEVWVEFPFEDYFFNFF